MKTVIDENGIEVFYHCTIKVPILKKSFDCEYNSSTIGRDLLGFVCQRLKCTEPHLWGLQYSDDRERAHWLRLEKLIRPQIKTICPVVFDFVLKVYPDEPQKVLDEDSRHMILLQIMHDLLTKPLICSLEEAVMLVALQLQRRLGDYNEAEHTGNYAKDVKVLKCQTIPVEEKAMVIHRSHLAGLNAVQCEDLLMRMVSQMASYGAQMFDVADETGAPVKIGINRKGMFAFCDNEKLHHYDWDNIATITHKANTLHVHLKSGDASTAFRCATDDVCEYIFQRAIEQQVYVIPDSEFVTESESTAREERPHVELVHKVSGSSIDENQNKPLPEDTNDTVEIKEEELNAPWTKYSWRSLCFGAFMYGFLFGATIAISKMVYTDYWHNLRHLYDSLCTSVNYLLGREVRPASYFPYFW